MRPNPAVPLSYTGTLVPGEVRRQRRHREPRPQVDQLADTRVHQRVCEEECRLQLGELRMRDRDIVLDRLDRYGQRSDAVFLTGKPQKRYPVPGQ